MNHYETVTSEDRITAIKMYTKLQKQGKIEKQDPLFGEYARPVIQMLLDEYIAIDVSIYRLQDTIYLSPGVVNTFLGMTNEEARKLFKVKDNKELFVCYFAILVLLASFYNSDYQAAAGRSFLLVSQLAERMNEYLSEANELEDETLDTKISEDGIQYREIIKFWIEKATFDVTVQEIRMASNNQISFLLRHPLAALENEELLVITEDESVIRLLPKMKHLIEGGYFDVRRKEKLLNVLKRED
ncbi:DUF6063 family protein [Brevibacillus formosus]|uniref:DUF6063 family protein n=1 Tax=Brevibacillus formosus TaxID=54913 RepID=UPI0018CF368C|nr:hypothetical protein [Brevibacillus formosus]